MMDGRAGHGQGLARGGIFGEVPDGDDLLTAMAGTSSAESLAGPGAVGAPLLGPRESTCRRRTTVVVGRIDGLEHHLEPGAIPTVDPEGHEDQPVVQRRRTAHGAPTT
jgi:hypothetical protein